MCGVLGSWLVRRLGVLGLTLSALVFPAHAAADFTEVDVPEAQSFGYVAEAGSTWILIPSAPTGQLTVSHDLGATWESLNLPSGDLNSSEPVVAHLGQPTVTASGSVLIPGVESFNTGRRQLSVFEVNGGGSEVESIRTGQLSHATSGEIDIVSDSSGKTWLATGSSFDEIAVYQLSAAGTVEMVIDVPLEAKPDLVEVGGRIFVGIVGGFETVHAFEIRDGAAIDVGPGLPQWSRGDLSLSVKGISRDGGASFASACVPRAPTPGMPDLMTTTSCSSRDSLAIATPAGFVPAGPRWPLETTANDTYFFAGSEHILGHDTEGQRLFAAPRTELASTPIEGTFPGGPAHDRLAEYRSQLQLPPVGPSRPINDAALNHARFLALNPDQFGHVESRGSAGFTGERLSDRCTFAGTFCGGEGISGGGAGASGIDRLMNTVYHRTPLLSPELSWAGFGSNDRMLVGNYQLGSSFSFDPIGYPSGDYSGPLDFREGEIPDPLDRCSDEFKYPVGQPVSLWVPAKAKLLSFELRSSRDVGQGCLITDRPTLAESNQTFYFIPREPLDPGQQYVASVKWLDDGNAQDGFSWSFTTPRCSSDCSTGGDVGGGAGPSPGSEPVTGGLRLKVLRTSRKRRGKKVVVKMRASETIQSSRVRVKRGKRFVKRSQLASKRRKLLMKLKLRKPKTVRTVLIVNGERFPLKVKAKRRRG